MQLLAALAISASAPFVNTLDQVDPPATTTAAPAPAAAPAASSNGAPANSPLSNLVADAIKRKLEKVAANKTGGMVELPNPATAAAAGGIPASSPMMPSTATPFGPGSAPEPSMMTGGTRLMMGAPADGSPSYIRVVTPAAGEPADAAGTKPSNPLATSTDPMETGTVTAAAAAEPGVNHNLLDIFVGTWDVSANFDNGPGQPPETASGQMINSWQLEGRWLKQEYTGKMASLGSFRGLGYLGYDNLAKCFVGTWMDTLSTSCMTSRGAFNEEKATFTLTGDFTGPGGEKFRQKQVMTVLSPDRYTVTMYLAGPDGVEFKTGNLEYTRSIRTITSVSVK